MRQFTFACGIVLGMLSAAASGYEVSTHQMLSDAAAHSSVLVGSSSILADLNLPALDEGTDYVPSLGPAGSAANAIRIGARYEDEAYLARVFNHFYDPQFGGFTGRGLTVGATGNASPDWAIEDFGDISDIVGPQIFSYRQAEQAYFLGMTSAAAADRRAWLARMFQSLGHVVHHIQDMAQPQHTRNDPHLSYTPLSLYEAYTRDRIRSQDAMNAFLTANPYPAQPPDFETAREYWTVPGPSTATYRGMAEFTAENFVSRGTEFVITGAYGAETINPAPGFPFPNGSGKSWQRNQPMTLAVNIGAVGSINGRGDFIAGRPSDGLGNNWPVVKLAATSLLDPYLAGHGLSSSRLAIESPTAFDEMHTVLLPRTTAFSAGLINHFFRARLDIQRSSSTSTTWNIRNLSTRALNGTFFVYTEIASTGARSAVSGGPWAANLAPNATLPVTFPDPPNSPAKVIVVFKGQIGSEPGSPTADWFAVAAKVSDFSPQAIQCGHPLSAQGSSGLYNPPLVELGTAPGRVQAEFEAYDIPDALKITYGNAGGTTVVDTHGQVSGFHTYEWQHNGSAQSSTKLFINLTGNQDPQTRWTLTVGCPGQTIGNSDRAQPRITITIGKGVTQGSGCQSGTTAVSVNGTQIGTITFTRFGVATNLTPTVTVGTRESIGLVTTIGDFGIPGTQCDGNGAFFFTDRAGTHTLPNNGGIVAIQ